MYKERFKALVKIAQKARLKHDRLTVFIEYILRRFPDEEEYYWKEWATRFALGKELTSSDEKGRVIIGDIAAEYSSVYAHIELEWRQAFS